jgi:hypothetical protein
MGLPEDMASKSPEGMAMEVPYPAQTKQAAAEINGILTEVMTIYFSDRIMVSISQDGRLAQWVSYNLYFPASFHG